MKEVIYVISNIIVFLISFSCKKKKKKRRFVRVKMMDKNILSCYFTKYTVFGYISLIIIITYPSQKQE